MNGSSSIDPADVSEVSAGLLAALEISWPGAELARPPEFVPAATSTWVWFVELAGDAVPAATRDGCVLRIFDRDQQDHADAEARLCDALADLGYPAPATLWSGQLGDHPAQLQQRLPGVPVMDVIAGTRIRSVVTSMATLQARLHGTPTEMVDVPRRSAADYLEADLAPRRAAVSASDPEGLWDWLNRTAPSVDRSEFVLCHGDFHPLNAVIAPDGSIGIVDWTDACLADRLHDVGRTTALFDVAHIVGSTRAERWSLRLLRTRLVAWHLHAYEREAGAEIDPALLAWWQAVHTYRGWLQLAELAEHTVTDRPSTTIESLPADLTARLLDRCSALRRRTGR